MNDLKPWTVSGRGDFANNATRCGLADNDPYAHFHPSIVVERVARRET